MFIHMYPQVKLHVPHVQNNQTGTEPCITFTSKQTNAFDGNFQTVLFTTTKYHNKLLYVQCQGK